MCSHESLGSLTVQQDGNTFTQFSSDRKGRKDNIDGWLLLIILFVVQGCYEDGSLYKALTIMIFLFVVQVV